MRGRDIQGGCEVVDGERKSEEMGERGNGDILAQEGIWVGCLIYCFELGKRPSEGLRSEGLDNLRFMSGSLELTVVRKHKRVYS